MAAISAVAKERVERVVNGGALRSLLHDGYKLPMAKGLQSGLYRVAVVIQPFGEGEKENAAKVQIWWGGAADL